MVQKVIAVLVGILTEAGSVLDDPLIVVRLGAVIHLMEAQAVALKLVAVEHLLAAQAAALELAAVERLLEAQAVVLEIVVVEHLLEVQAAALELAAVERLLGQVTNLHQAVVLVEDKALAEHLQKVEDDTFNGICILNIPT